MKFFASPLLFLLVSLVWISVLSSGMNSLLTVCIAISILFIYFLVADAQKKYPKKQRDDTLTVIGDNENVDIGGTENTDRTDDDDDKDNSDRRNRFPDKKNNRNNTPDKKKPYDRNQDDDLEDSDESFPSKDGKRKHWKKDKHMKKHKHWKKKKHWDDLSPCSKHDRHHSACKHYRKHHHHHRDHHDHHDYHHHHHHDDRRHRHRKPSHRRHGHSEEDDDNEIINIDKTNKGRGKGKTNWDDESSSRRRDGYERNPDVNYDKTTSEPSITDRNTNTELER
jgi:hypothetical protein